MARETEQAAELRWKKLRLLQKHYANFTTFMADMMKELGFDSTEMQEDIANYLQYGPQYLMVQAQRGEAKTTITAMFAVWCLIHDPKHRVLIVSAGGKTANEIATLVQRIILTVNVLECLRPDPNAGDRTSVEAFDVHYTLKGIDKSPSVACIGITGNLPGKRADLLIADDIESPKNSLTAAARAILLTMSLEFTSINSRGRIIYLGTPQTNESIYNVLPGRGFHVRIWPGRFPTPAQRAKYADMLAPYIIKKLEANPALAFGGGLNGDRGQPTDPIIMDEESLCTKEKQGTGYFELNYMLNTALSDAMRHPLKLENIIVLRGGDGIHFPVSIVRGFNDTHRKAYTSSGIGFNLSLPHTMSETLAKLEAIHMAIDPAGGGANADETGYAVVGFLNGNIFVLEIGGVPGGYGQEGLDHLADVAAKWKVQDVTIEKNMGHGAFAAMFLPTLRKKHQCAVHEPFETGQKELRIIGTLEPIIARGSLIIMESCVQQDDESTARYDVGARITYSVFHQLAKITKQRKCLAHDDRADALESACRKFIVLMSIDQHKKEAAEKEAKLAAFMRDPLGRNRVAMAPSRHNATVLSRFRR